LKVRILAWASFKSMWRPSVISTNQMMMEWIVLLSFGWNDGGQVTFIFRSTL
jgi:hypothetical protein